jgi:uncharacterized SAM-binding protein YcdF (DUF218 family)
MGFFISKFLSQLIYPLSLGIFTALAGLTASGRLRKTGAVLVCVSSLSLWACSTPFVAGWISSGLERRYPPVPVRESPTADVIVVLGGAMPVIEPPRVELELVGTSDRVLHASRLYRAGKARQIIASGGAIPFMGLNRPEAPAIGALLEEWGVPKDAVVLETGSRNTYENAINTRPILAGENGKKMLLVTSAMHMPRALATFRKAGMDAIPSPTDFNTVDREGLTVFDFLPDAEALVGTTKAVKEHMGLVYYRLRGWI